jgi:autotransporter-associated beta strand protein
MNHIYRLVWNKAQHCWSPASELTRSQSKRAQRAAAAIALLGLGASQAALATDYTWKGNCTPTTGTFCRADYWSSGSWTPSGVPDGAGDNIIFSGTAYGLPVIESGVQYIGDVIFRDTSQSYNYAFTDGFGVQLYGSIRVENTVSADQEMSLPIYFRGDTSRVTNESSSTLRLSGSVTSSNAALVLDGSGLIDIAGLLSAKEIQVQGTSRLTGSFDGEQQLEVGPGGEFIVDTASTPTVFRLENQGTLTLNQGTLQLSGFGSSSGNIEGSGGIRIDSNAGYLADQGPIVFSGNNSYTGDTEIVWGTLKVIDGNLGSSARIIINNGTLDLTESGTTLGTIYLQSLGGSGTLLLGENDLLLTDAKDDTFSGILSGDMSLGVQTGTQGLAGANTYTGDTKIENGATLALRDNGSITTSNEVDVNGILDLSGLTNGGTSVQSISGGGSITLGANNLTITDGKTEEGFSLSPDAGTFSGTISGSGAVIISGGLQTLSGTNTYTGGTQLKGGTLKIASDASLGDAGTELVFDGGTLKPSTDMTIDRAITVNDGGGTMDIFSASAELSGVIGGSGSLHVTRVPVGFSFIGPGMPDAYDNNTLTLSAANTYRGGTLIDRRSTAIFTNGRSFSTGTITLASTGGELRAGADGIELTNNIRLDSTDILNPPTSGSFTGHSPDIFNTNGYTTTLSGQLFGAGGLRVTGEGTLALTGNNLYAGPTSIAPDTRLELRGTGSIANSSSVEINGTLDLAGLTNGGASLKSILGSGYITLGANDLTLTHASGHFSGVIAGDGALVVSGGTQVLSGTNTYGGGTRLDGGILSISSDTSLGGAGTSLSFDGGTLQTTASLFLTRDATLDAGGGSFDTAAGTTLTYSGILQGDGALSKRGEGTLILANASDYTGGTTLYDGVVQLRNDDGLGTGDIHFDGGAIEVGATYTFVDNNATLGAGGGKLIGGGSSILVYRGAIGGNGTLTTSGYVLLRGANTYGGGTFVTDGHVRGNTTSLQGDFTNNGIVIFDQDFDGAYAGNMTGNGALHKWGAGTLDLSGSHDYAGETIVAGGTLKVNGSIASAVRVEGGSTLGGNGTIGSVTLNNGTLAPGNSIGTLNVSGDIDFSGGGMYAVEVDATGNGDRVVASGTAFLSGGAVQVTPEAGDYNYSTNYTILTAGAIDGEFNSVSSMLAFLDPALTYDGNNVYLNLTRNDIQFTDVARTPNQRAVAGTITTIADQQQPGGDLQTLLNELARLTGTGAQQAYDSLSGVQHTNVQSVMAASGPRFGRLLATRSDALAASPGVHVAGVQSFTPTKLAYGGELGNLQLATSDTKRIASTPTMGSGLWITPRVGLGTIDDTDNAAGADYDFVGLGGGADKWLDEHSLVGGGIAFTRTNIDPEAGRMEVDSLELALYGRWGDGIAHLDGQLVAGWHDVDSSRQVVVGGLNQTASTDYGARAVGFSLEAGQSLQRDASFVITPFAGLDAMRLEREGFRETGAGAANLVAEEETLSTVRPRIGLRVKQDLALDGGRRVTTDLDAAWAHELADNEAVLRSGFESAPLTDFVVSGPDLDANRVLLNAGLTTQLGKTAQLRLGYAGDLATSDQFHSFSGAFRLQW